MGADYDGGKEVATGGPRLIAGVAPGMQEGLSFFGLLRDARLSPYALDDTPVWLWSADASRILWGNPAAAALFTAPSAPALVGRTIDPKGTAALQIARLAGTLPHGAQPRLERLRGFGGRMGGALLCACSRIQLADGTPAILMVAAEPSGQVSTMAQKAKQLIGDSTDPVAVFSSQGTLLASTSAVTASLNGAASLEAIGLSASAIEAIRAGRTETEINGQRVVIDRIGAGDTTALMLTVAQSASRAPPSQAPVALTTSPPMQQPQRTHPPANEPVATVASPPVAHKADQPERRQRLRFVWKVDEAGLFTINGDQFTALLAPEAASLLGQTWEQITASSAIDSDGQFARALASRDTFSGVTVEFPLEDDNTVLPVEMSGLPVFDRDRTFLGYRGFGVCREAIQIDRAAASRQPERRVLPKSSEVDPSPVETTKHTGRRPEPPVFREYPAQAPVNVLPFPAGGDSAGALTPVERNAFSELGTRLAAQLRSGDRTLPAEPARPTRPAPSASLDEAPPSIPTAPEPRRPSERRAPMPTKATAAPPARSAGVDQRPILDRLPIGVLVYRLDKLIYGNRAFLEWTGYPDLAALEEAGGLDALFVEPQGDAAKDTEAQALTIATNQGDQVPVDARLFTSPWQGESAMVLMLTGTAAATSTDDRQKTFQTALRHAKAEVEEIREILDSAADGVVVLDGEHRVSSLNRGAEKLFGYESHELTGLPFTTLFATESQRDVDAALRGAQKARAGTVERGRDLIGRRREGGLVPLFMTMSRLDGDDQKLCAIFRDMTFWKKTEGELLNARRQAEQISSAKSDFLAKISHEIRTPLNAIVGFSEVMMQERFGPIGNERYRQYLKDIHTSGGHLVGLLTDLLDLSKIEAGRLDLSFADLDLNELAQQSVAQMQSQASQERIIIRTSLDTPLPPVTADERSVRQIVQNLLANSMRFTGVGGQVIVSTARGDDGDVILRVRDTGVGMSEQDIAVAMEPFRHLAVSGRWGSGGTGLALPLTRALAEANRARFRIRSVVNSGTLVEVAFAGPRQAAE